MKCLSALLSTSSEAVVPLLAFGEAASSVLSSAGVKTSIVIEGPVGVFVEVGAGVAVGVLMGEFVGVDVGVELKIPVGVAVFVGVLVGMRVLDGVAVGDAEGLGLAVAR